MAKENGLEIAGGYVKAFHKKVGDPKTRLTLVAPLTPDLARKLRIHSAVFTQENMPKPELLEVKLKVQKTPNFTLRLEVPSVPDVLIVGCDEALDWVATQKGTSKKGRPTKLMVEWKVKFVGAAVGVFEWLEKYGGASGKLTLGDFAPEQMPLPQQEAEPPMSKAAKAGRVQ